MEFVAYIGYVCLGWQVGGAINEKKPIRALIIGGLTLLLIIYSAVYHHQKKSDANIEKKAIGLEMESVK